MPTLRVSKLANNALYFTTLTVKHWYHIFDRHNRWQILADSIKHCQQHKHLQVYAYVFMLNHLHLIVGSPDIAGFLRDFKAHTSKHLLKNIKETEPVIFDLFKNEDGSSSFWKDGNQPKILESENFTQQKINYVHNNPVAKQYVLSPEHWKWSSANPHSEIRITAFE